jgi:hypothetical protein
MATSPVLYSPVLRRLAADLDAGTVESRLTTLGDLIAEFDAMGHMFRFRITQEGTIVERSCHTDTAGVLSRPEMQVLRDLAGLELARMGHGHLDPARHGSDVLGVLGRAEIKLSLALSNGDTLSSIEREFLTQALNGYVENLHARSGDPALRGEARAVVTAIH